MKTKRITLDGISTIAHIETGAPIPQPRAAGEAEHTPTPWKIADPKTVAPALHPFPCIQSANSGKMIADTCEHGAKGSANAAFIVRACNAHAGLVEALAEILHDHAACIASEQPGFLTDSQVEKARAALQSARE